MRIKTILMSVLSVILSVVVLTSVVTAYTSDGPVSFNIPFKNDGTAVFQGTLTWSTSVASGSCGLGYIDQNKSHSTSIGLEGTYYEAGSSQEQYTANGNGGPIGCSTSIVNYSGNMWNTLKMTCNGNYNGESMQVIVDGQRVTQTSF